MTFDPHNPQFVTLDRAAERISANGPYARVKRAFDKGDYDTLATILRRNGTALEADAIPSFLLWLSTIDHAGLGDEMQIRGAFRELTYCATVAKRLAGDDNLADIVVPQGVDEIAGRYAGDPGALKDLAPHYEQEFRHFYDAYRHRHNDSR